MGKIRKFKIIIKYFKEILNNNCLLYAIPLDFFKWFNLYQLLGMANTKNCLKENNFFMSICNFLILSIQTNYSFKLPSKHFSIIHAKQGKHAVKVLDNYISLLLHFIFFFQYIFFYVFMTFYILYYEVLLEMVQQISMKMKFIFISFNSPNT